MNCVVLGCGLVGSAMALDLAAHGFRVTSVDADESAFRRLGNNPDIQTRVADLSRPETVRQLVAPFDLVIGAVPGFLGYRTVKAVIAAGRNMIDISFFPEDPFPLEKAARNAGVTVITDCGVAPGFSHLACGYITSRLERTDSLEILVGGLPQVRRKPFEYNIVFSALDVIEEYTRPARVVENGTVVVKEPLSEIEEHFFPGIGTLESFNSDGLRSLVKTLEVPWMREKTLRYPGHAEKMKLLRDSGFFAKDPVTVDGRPVVPLELTARVLFPKLQLPPDEGDLTVMTITGKGLRNGRKSRLSFSLLDYFDPKTGITSMARTTGYTATSVAALWRAGKIRSRGLVLPEYLGREEGFLDLLLGELAGRGVHYRREESAL